MQLNRYRILRGPAIAVAALLLVGSAAMASQMALSPKSDDHAGPSVDSSASPEATVSDDLEGMESPEATASGSAEASPSEDESDLEDLFESVDDASSASASASPSMDDEHETEDESDDDSEYEDHSMSASASASPTDGQHGDDDGGTDD